MRHDPTHDRPSSYMHHAFRTNDVMEDLTRRAWDHYGKPPSWSEDQVLKVFEHALGAGNFEDVNSVHERTPWKRRLDNVGGMLEPLHSAQSSGTRVYDVHANMPDIQHFQLPPELTPTNLQHYHQLRHDIGSYLRNRNYSNEDIAQKLDELFMDLGGLQNPQRGVRWS